MVQVGVKAGISLKKRNNDHGFLVVSAKINH